MTSRDHTEPLLMACAASRHDHGRKTNFRSTKTTFRLFFAEDRLGPVAPYAEFGGLDFAKGAILAEQPIVRDAAKGCVTDPPCRSAGVSRCDLG